MKQKKKRDKKYTPKPIRQPGIRLSEKDAESLALRTHLAAVAIDREEGLTQFIDIVCKVTVAMTTAETMDKHSRAILGTTAKMLDEVMKTGKITDNQEAYIGRTAGFINDWLLDGRIRYSDLEVAKKAMRRVDARIVAKHADNC